jgi:hypothetical protein
MFADAVSEAKEALRLDQLLAPHPDKRLTEAIREQLRKQLPGWTKQAEAMPEEFRR